MDINASRMNIGSVRPTGCTALLLYLLLFLHHQSSLAQEKRTHKYCYSMLVLDMLLFVRCVMTSDHSKMVIHLDLFLQE